MIVLRLSDPLSIVTLVRLRVTVDDGLNLL